MKCCTWIRCQDVNIWLPLNPFCTLLSGTSPPRPGPEKRVARLRQNKSFGTYLPHLLAADSPAARHGAQKIRVAPLRHLEGICGCTFDC